MERRIENVVKHPIPTTGRCSSSSVTTCYSYSVLGLSAADTEGPNHMEALSDDSDRGGERTRTIFRRKNMCVPSPHPVPVQLEPSERRTLGDKKVESRRKRTKCAPTRFNLSTGASLLPIDCNTLARHAKNDFIPKQDAPKAHATSSSKAFEPKASNDGSSFPPPGPCLRLATSIHSSTSLSGKKGPTVSFFSMQKGDQWLYWTNALKQYDNIALKCTFLRLGAVTERRRSAGSLAKPKKVHRRWHSLNPNGILHIS